MDGLKEKNGNFWNRYQNRMRGIQKGRLSVLLLALLLFFRQQLWYSLYLLRQDLP